MNGRKKLSSRHRPNPQDPHFAGAEEEEEVMDLDEAENDDELSNIPLEPSLAVPIFPDLDQPEALLPTKIKVTKTDAPGAGYKGEVPVTFRLEDISAKWGDGIYDFLLINAKGKFLRRQNGIQIAVGAQRIGAEHGGGAGMADVKEILREERARAAAALESQLAQIRAQAAEDQRRADGFLSLVTQTRKAESEQTRDFYAAQALQQQQAFQNMMQMTAQGHQQTLNMMLNLQQQNNPLLFLKVFQEGMNQGDNGGDAEPVELQVLKQAGESLKDITQLAMLGKGLKTAKPKAVGSGMPKMPSMPANAAHGAPAKPNTPQKIQFSDEEKKEIAALKKLCDEKGLDMAALAKQARAYVSSGAPSEADDEDDDDLEDDEEDTDSEESPDDGADMDGTEHHHEERPEA